ncbi:MAG: VapC toxin family PIN domain ribonuclease [Desulfobacca sp.]|nr:VapC toxin family PIN domain ribonuclease [Desulfobacca sp.]
MILYCDTSALIKRYVEEDGSKEVDHLWERGSEIITSTVAFAEIMAAFRRKYREGILSKSGYLKTVSEFKKEYPKLILVSISPDLNQMVEKLLFKHSLRGFDAIHLASALLIQNEGPLTVNFACFDRQLNKAAAEEGLIVPF